MRVVAARELGVRDRATPVTQPDPPIPASLGVYGQGTRQVREEVLAVGPLDLFVEAVREPVEGRGQKGVFPVEVVSHGPRRRPDRPADIGQPHPIEPVAPDLVEGGLGDAGALGFVVDDFRHNRDYINSDRGRKGGSDRLPPPMARYERKDHLHQKAKKEGLRSRAAYKLEEVQKQFKLLSKGQRVLDLGCWPGGWMEVAVRLVGGKGRVVGIDLAEVDPKLAQPNATTLVGDLEDPATAGRLVEALGGDRADVVLSDAAPKLTGVRETDRANEERLLEAIETLLPKVLAPGGDFVIKILEGPEAQQVDQRMRKSFAKAKTVKLKATRKGSTERYLVARGYRGAE